MDDVLTPELRRLFRKAMRAAYAKGKRQVIEPLRFLSNMNGSVGTFLKAWDESQHPRDHGQFSSQPGSTGEGKTPKKLPTRKHVDNWRSLAEHYRKVGEDHHAAIPALVEKV